MVHLDHVLVIPFDLVLVPLLDLVLVAQPVDHEDVGGLHEAREHVLSHLRLALGAEQMSRSKACLIFDEGLEKMNGFKEK